MILPDISTYSRLEAFCMRLERDSEISNPNVSPSYLKSSGANNILLKYYC